MRYGLKGFCLLKIKIVQFPDLFRLKPFRFEDYISKVFEENDEVLREN